MELSYLFGTPLSPLIIFSKTILDYTNKKPPKLGV
jgi:hypothetical protein